MNTETTNSSTPDDTQDWKVVSLKPTALSRIVTFYNDSQYYTAMLRPDFRNFDPAESLQLANGQTRIRQSLEENLQDLRDDLPRVNDYMIDLIEQLLRGKRLAFGEVKEDYLRKREVLDRPPTDPEFYLALKRITHVWAGLRTPFGLNLDE